MGSCTKSIRSDLSKGNMTFSEESRRAIYEMGTSATIQCPSCLKHVPEGLNMCLWASDFDPIMDRIRAAFAALKTPYFRTAVILSRRKKKWTQPVANGSSQCC